MGEITNLLEMLVNAAEPFRAAAWNEADFMHDSYREDYQIECKVTVAECRELEAVMQRLSGIRHLFVADVVYAEEPSDE